MGGGRAKNQDFQISIFGHFGHFCKKWKICIESEGGVGQNLTSLKKVPFLKAPTGIGSKIHGPSAEFFEVHEKMRFLQSVENQQLKP